MSDVIYKTESYRIIGACLEVYNEKGCGFLEAVYSECLSLELRMQEVDCEFSVPIALSYKGHPLSQRYRADAICFGKIVLESKAVSALTNEHRAQIINYLHATSHKLGLLVNFGHPSKLEWERFVL